ncbi:uncharacterized protein AC631_00425 [Debaryomyces fabryi]|uniref:inorganic diphosphatase n=1 Tax=Debaryomyces fabryi TaxID=58627 RepID=A0A0V1Q5J6_9ASCO|nr:uncharacterized protein AC631_00425 [Debaryomyces fabryi]KSA03790.1 hypothetical protein AC631_00425 [Debaryomyces fabryi]CUM45308.1 unnamed protein product [Debaryomyces fabryi]
MSLLKSLLSKNGESLLRTSMNKTAISRLFITKLHLQPTRCNSILHTPQNSIGNVDQGVKYTTDFRNYAINKENGEVLSYFHDIPLDLDLETKTANIVVEIPRWSNGKFEINTELAGNPITQDVKKGKVRFVKNLFPYHGYIHNYGAFPQTWEDPNTKNEELGLFGDNDPLDVCEIGSSICQTGDIKRVKILGCLALIDDGELDWKVIVIDTNDALSQELRDIHDVYVKCPGLLESTRQWFRDYKKPDGKPENEFAFNGKYKNQQETIEIIKECNASWQKLINGQVTSGKIPKTENVTFTNSPGHVSKFDTQILLENSSKPAAEIPSEVDKIYFCGGD